jgi:hypothetical protein
MRVNGENAVVLPTGHTLLLPEVGEIVHVAFPQRAWLCPALVLQKADIPAGATLTLLIFNMNTFPMLQLRKKVPHSAFGNGAELCWSRIPNQS